MKTRSVARYSYLLVAILFLLSSLPGCTSLASLTNQVQIGELSRVSQVPYVLEPDIAVDPKNPSHLVAVMTEIPSFECTFGACQWTITRYTSDDGGITWRRDLPFGDRYAGDPVAGFGPDGALYTVGLVGSPGKPTVDVKVTEQQSTGGSSVDVSPLTGSDKPWLTVDPKSGNLYVTYSGHTILDSGGLGEGILLQTSSDGGKTWSTTTTLDQGVVPSGTQGIPVGAQTVLGKGSDLAVLWLGAIKLGTASTDLQLATSTDDGKTFSKPRTIAKTWGFFTTAFHDGTYYVFYLKGDQPPLALAMAVSHDDGATWQTSVISGKLPLDYIADKGPGVGVAPDGTIDVVFYANQEGAPACLDLAARLKWAEQPWIDHCQYDVYYTFSRDGGQSFHAPVKLNRTPIVGERFIRSLSVMEGRSTVGGTSRPGEYIGMASTDKYAYPIWIDTQGSDGTQAYMVRIER